MLTLGSMFAGIGGLELGFESTGRFETKWQVEIDDYATKVLEKNWPEVKRWKDVCTFPPRPNQDWQCDIIAAGFPCQDVSTAGKGEGLSGKRSGLFFQVIRVAQVIRPRAIVLENVSALYVRGLDVVLGELAKIGYDSEWHCVSAASVGAPHRRDRVFIIGYVADSSSLRQSGSGMYGRSFDSTESSNWEASNVKPGGQRKKNHWHSEPAVGRVADGVPKRMDRLRCLGNAIVPQVAQVVAERLLEILDDQDPKPTV